MPGVLIIGILWGFRGLRSPRDPMRVYKINNCRIFQLEGGGRGKMDFIFEMEFFYLCQGEEAETLRDFDYFFTKGTLLMMASFLRLK
jgi:hypothetical protein